MVMWTTHNNFVKKRSSESSGTDKFTMSQRCRFDGDEKYESNDKAGFNGELDWSS